MRMGRKKGLKDRAIGRKTEPRRLSADELLRVYQREADKQRLLARKADFAQARLLFIVEAMKDILSDEGFVTLLKAEGLATMPRALATRIEGRQRP
jgi:ParB family chromosome partitioning protein